MNENDNYLNFPGLSQFFEKIKEFFVEKNELNNIKSCTDELAQQIEPTTQKVGDYWLQNY